MSTPIQGPTQSANQVTTLQTSGATKPNILNSDIGVSRVNITGNNGVQQTNTSNMMMGVSAFLNT